MDDHFAMGSHFANNRGDFIQWFGSLGKLTEKPHISWENRWFPLQMFPSTNPLINGISGDVHLGGFHQGGGAPPLVEPMENA